MNWILDLLNAKKMGYEFEDISEVEGKLMSLIETGEEENITLAFQLAKSNGIVLDLSEYREIYKWLSFYQLTLRDSHSNLLLTVNSNKTPKPEVPIGMRQFIYLESLPTLPKTVNLCFTTT